MPDSKVTEAFADGRVPEGITADYLNESKDGAAIAGIIFVTVFASIVVITRLLSRAVVLRRIGLDDYLTLASWISSFLNDENERLLTVLGATQITFIPFVALCIRLINLGSGRHYEYIQYVLDMPTVEVTEVLDFAAHIIYTTSLLICRLSGLAFYHHLCAVNPKFLLAIKIVFAVMILGYLPQLFLLIFHCVPVTGLWPYEWQPGVEKYTCLQWGLVYSVNSAVSLVCDLFLFGIPIVMIWVLKISRRRKIQLGAILLPGILVVGISITRLVFVIEGQWNADMSWAYNPMLAIEVTEIGATLVALSIPGVKPFVDKCIFRRDVNSETDTKGISNYGNQSSRHNDTALRSLHFRSGYDGRQNLDSDRETSAEGFDQYKNRPKSSGDQSESSANGILVQVDFQIKEDSQPTGRAISSS